LQQISARPGDIVFRPVRVSGRTVAAGSVFSLAMEPQSRTGRRSPARREQEVMDISAPITVIGHPFANIGMGEQLRSCLRSLQSVLIDFRVIDVFRISPRVDHEHLNLVLPLETRELPAGIRIFHVNGDEIDNVLKGLSDGRMRFSSGFNILVPAWELPRYPDVWVDAVKKFDEVWAQSKFIQTSFSNTGLDSHHIGQSVEVAHRPFLSRKYFGISESAFVFLNCFDLTSYASRKNPEAALGMFRTLKRRRPYDDIQFVFKVKNGHNKATEWVAPLREEFKDVIFISQPLTSLENVSLIAACDCFVSLHRSEGFGRAPGEAMFLGRLAMATGWSGNMDYMDPDSALLVNFELTSVPEGAYPHGAGQAWAEVDVDHSVHLALKVLDDPSFARRLERAGRRAAFARAGNRAVGLRMAERIAQVTLCGGART